MPYQVKKGGQGGTMGTGGLFQINSETDSQQENAQSDLSVSEHNHYR